MTHSITLNLETNEYLDTFSNETGNDGELWQLAAKERLIDLLKSTGNDAKAYKRKFTKENTKICAVHNSICISGSRGAGKTVFLRSAEQIWQEHAKNHNTELVSLSFLDVIDPTLLDGHDKFSNVIVAQLYNAVEKKLESQTVKQQVKNDFYNALKQLAESLGKSCEFDDFSGIDRILKYRSGVQIELFFHSFVAECTRLLGCDAIVIPIDDVDMALNRAFEVLDDVRRLLSCPLIIPLVSGDHKLYSHMANVHFEELATKQRTSDKTKGESRSTALDLAEAYLTKVFPNHLRLPLLPISHLLPRLEIKLQQQAGVIKYLDYVSSLNKKFFPLCNGQERSTQWNEPGNAREVNQLVRSIQPSNMEDIFVNQDLWRRFQTWGEQKKDGAVYTNAESFSQVVEMYGNNFNINKLVSFSPKLQINEGIGWANKDFFNGQLEHIKNLRPSNASKTTKQSTLFSNVQQEETEIKEPQDKNEEIFRSVYRNNGLTLRSMPVLEFFIDNLRINLNEANKDPSHILLALYTHHDYYNAQSNSTYHVFFSRAFEILVLSLINLTTTQNDQLTTDWNKQLEKIFLRPPFYSIFAVNPTKMIDEESDESGRISTSTKDSNLSGVINTLSTDINDWLTKYTEKLKDIPELQNINLFPLLSAVFNKVFTQLHILRTNMVTKKMKGDEEHLTDIARRFEYIFINALASFTRDGEVINSNTSNTAKQSTLRDHLNFFDQEKTLQRNLKGLVDRTGQSIETKDLEVNIPGMLIEAIWAHPIFVANKSRQNMTTPLFLLKGQNSPPVPPADNTEAIPEEAVKEYLDKLMDKVKNKIRRLGEAVDFKDKKSIDLWVSNNKPKANELLNELKNALKEKNKDESHFLDRHPAFQGTLIYKALSGK
ncbi:antiviral RADAR system adenosine triphosphatase RdrA [Pseudoalteromonas rhizosphaerae]|uniref:Antiviral RADAR system adenosine triphosphatase RdrA n=1 Tax=Pseudoalteromonas rhizosphaerae TaxID=2518973 RepID=A0ABW8L3H3_9GAMM